MRINGLPVNFALSAALVFMTACADVSSPPGETEPAPTHEASQAEHGGGPPHWDYGETDGPAIWAQLSEEYALCRDGREQSPVDISGAEAREQPAMSMAYRPAKLKIIRHEHVVDVVDNGHTIQVNYDEGSTLTVGEASYDLKQYHFHAPSEHTVEGRSFRMEMHLVHQSAGGALAVLGVLIAEGSENPAFVPVWEHLPDTPGESRHLEHVTVNIEDLLPESHATYRYAGSLTTPPCSEGVRWFVVVEPIELSADQISAFTAIFSNNNRPVQPLYGRTVVVDRLDG